VPLDVGRDVDALRVLARHVEDVERAVGRVDEIDRSKPEVGRADELRVGVGALAPERHALWHEDAAMDEVAHAVADEDVSIVLLRIGPAAIERHTRAGIDDIVAHTGDILHLELAHRDRPATLQIAPALNRTDPIDWRRYRRRARDRLARREVRIALQVFLRQHDVEARRVLGAEETVAEIVEREPELPRARDSLEPVGTGRETKIVSRHRNRATVGSFADRTSPPLPAVEP
jgi:hypothetical protein